MPARKDIKSVMLIGSGPIIIGQACEFDYSGAQSCRALKKDGYRVILVNSNPATIMTDPEVADKTYIEPLNCETIETIIAKERPDALLPTMGGQTALNLAVELAEKGILDKYSVELIGASLKAIKGGEDREIFKQIASSIGIESPKSAVAHTLAEAFEILEEIGLPAILRPSFTLGGKGGGIATNKDNFAEMVSSGLRASRESSVLIEESIIGWKEYELEVVRDKLDNAIIVCSIENIDPMGIHTGDSVTVAPAMTLTDKEYQKMRNSAIAILRAVEVDTGGANVQFAVDPKTGRQLVIEMNPRVSRSSALASKATGFPIARIATKLAVGYSLDEIANDITKVTPASFEPSIDYVVVKIPRFDFEKFYGNSPEKIPSLGTTMHSVGEVMAIGHSFSESLQKALRSLEIDLNGLNNNFYRKNFTVADLAKAIPNKLLMIADAIRNNVSEAEIAKLSKVDPWFIEQIANLVKFEEKLKENKMPDNLCDFNMIKSMGFSDGRLAELWQKKTSEVTARRKKLHCLPSYKRIDSTAGEIQSATPYMYSSFHGSDLRDKSTGSDNKPLNCECKPDNVKKVIVIGSGPNRIGQGIEFDYACVHACQAIKEMGYQSIMINCNPETVSTDFDVSDRLYFEPLEEESVINIIQKEMETGTLLGVILQFGGQTPLKLADSIDKAGIPILGTSLEGINKAEDRDQFQKILKELDIGYPEGGAASNNRQAHEIAEKIGYPLLLRPSFVIGGRAMKIALNKQELEKYLANNTNKAYYPILIDKFLHNAIEYDVDAVSDGENIKIAGILEHIEQAGIHSGDSACITPTQELSPAMAKEIKSVTKKLTLALQVVGLMNIQFAVCDNKLYVLEANPRASRTIPFISKIKGVSYAKIASKIMLGAKISDLNIKNNTSYTAVKEAVFPFNRFVGSDIVLGPEMRSTGEVMGIDKNPALAILKAQTSAGNELPKIGTCKGKIVFSIDDADKEQFLDLAKKVQSWGLKIAATRGTASYFASKGIKVEVLNKYYEGGRTIIDCIIDDEIAMLFNTGLGENAIKDGILMRRKALMRSVPYCTTYTGAKSSLEAMEAAHKHHHKIDIVALQDL